MTSRTARKRRARSVRVARPREGIAVADPLVHAASSRASGLSRAALVAIAAILFHAIAIGFIALASSIARGVGDDRRANIEVAVVDRPPPPPKVEVKPEPKPEPEKPKEPEKKQAVKPPPPKDPIDKPKEEPKPEEKPKEPVRRIIGLNLESTTSGGSGPSFATGNTRMGETEKKAAMPAEVAPIPANVDEKPVQGANKAATRIPIAGSKIVAPSRKKAIIPNYPERARQAGIEGDVVVRVTIDARGKPTAVAVVKAADLNELNEAAKEAALREEFSPATRDGVPIEYTLTYTYFFRLNG